MMSKSINTKIVDWRQSGNLWVLHSLHHFAVHSWLANNWINNLVTVRQGLPSPNEGFCKWIIFRSNAISQITFINFTGIKNKNMEVLEIKTQLHWKIDTIDNEELLLEALQILEFETELEELILPNEIIENVESARLDKLNGLFMEHTEANKQINKWLSGL